MSENAGRAEALSHQGADADWLDRLIIEQEAAAFLDVSARALQNWRVRGGGPPFVRISGRCIRYRRRDLIERSEARRQVNTSERTASDPSLLTRPKSDGPLGGLDRRN